MKSLDLSLCFLNSDVENQEAKKLLESMKTSINANISRLESNAQYCLKIANGTIPDCLKNIERFNTNTQNQVFFQGVEGAWANIAAKQLYPNSSLTNVPKFKDVFEEVSKDESAVGILPIDNSTAGAVTEVYDYLLNYNLYINKSINIPIEHCLASTSKEIRTIKRVISHPQALAQCSEFIESSNLRVATSLNTAVAAVDAAKNDNPEDAVLCSKNAAANAKLNVLLPNVSNSQLNETRFISVSRKHSSLSQANKISLILTLTHERGSLNDIISAFNDFNLNMTKIQSRPIPDKPFQFCFYIDFEGNITNIDAKALLLKFENELPEFRYLGNYEDTGTFKQGDRSKG